MHLVTGLGPMVPLDREALLHTLISGGGAMLLAYAMWVWATDRASHQQIRGLVLAGTGFLASAGASTYLRDRATVGAVVSLGGTFVAMYGMLLLVRERRDRAHGARRPSRPGRD